MTSSNRHRNRVAIVLAVVGFAVLSYGIGPSPTQRRSDAAAHASFARIVTDVAGNVSQARTDRSKHTAQFSGGYFGMPGKPVLTAQAQPASLDVN